MADKRVPLVADRSVDRGGFVPRIRSSATVLFGKAMGQVQSFME
jgi:D-alanyl-D-alanine carboxypeptidase (penicillin-binding protein 5/6)